MAKPALLLSQLNQWPPFLCHALARVNRKGRTQRIPFAALAADARMSKQKFFGIASRLSWNSVEAEDIERFCQACRTPIWSRMNRHKEFFDRQMQRRTD